MKRSIGNILLFAGIALLILFALTGLLNNSSPKGISQKITLYRKDKIPYGSYISYRLLQANYPGITVKDVYLPFYLQAKKIPGDTNNIYVILTPKFAPSARDVNALLHFIKKGNNVLIGAGDINNRLSDTLHFAANYLEQPVLFSQLMEDSFHLHLVNPHLDTSIFAYKGRPSGSFFIKLDSVRTKVLGVSENENTDFVRIKIGKGNLLLHLDPVAFSNYFLLQGNNYHYLDALLAYLPSRVNHIYWDDYYYHHLANEENNFSVWEAIMKYPSLRWAFFLTLLLTLLYVMAEMKRRQRVIPVIAPAKNTTVQFIKTLGALYLNKKDNRNMAEKMVNYLLEYIRSKFYLPTQYLDDHFCEQLSKRSGIELTEIQQLIYMIHQAMINFDLSDDQLVALNKSIEDFYQKTN